MTRRDRQARATPQRDKSARRAPKPAPPAPAVPAPALRLSHPAMVFVLLVALTCIALSVTFRIDDPDLWQHLRVGRAIWDLHSIPRLQVWCWPTYGETQVLPSWLFRAMLWPFWKRGGVEGLFVWRWLTTLAAFGFGLAAARRMGARGFTPFVVAVVAGLTWRHRSQVRPETLAAVMIAASIWILETRRAGGPDRSWWLVPIACLYANAHLSYYFGLLIIAIYALEDLRRRAARAQHLWRVLAAAVAASFLNPFGWSALWQPFDYFLRLRHELLFRTIGELAPLDWSRILTTSMPELFGGWLLLMLWRWRRAFDLAELLMFALFVGFGIASQRFLGLAAVVAVPFLARDLDAWVSSRHWPAWTRPAGTRAALAGAVAVIACVPGWRLPSTPFGVGIQMKYFPVGACDYMEKNHVRGRGFNPFYEGGYLLWRFWPQRDRLPFMDIHQTGTPQGRDLLARAYGSPAAYHALQSEFGFDWALLDRRAQTGPTLLDEFADDSTWAAVFMDDAAVVFVKRSGRLAALAERDAYRHWPAGWAGVDRMMDRWNSDAHFRETLRADLDRQVESSHWNSLAHQYRGILNLAQGDDIGAKPELEAALRVEPMFPNLHAMLGRIALRDNKPDEAARQFREELRLHPDAAGVRDELQNLKGSAR